MATADMKIQVIVIEESNKESFEKRLETLIQKNGFDRVKVLSSGVTIQRTAKDYWSIIAIIPSKPHIEA